MRDLRVGADVGDDDQLAVQHHPVRDAGLERKPAALPVAVECPIDPHLGVVTPDPREGGALREDGGDRWVDEQTVDPVGVFTRLADVGTGGGECGGFATTLAALVTEANGANSGFLREASSLVVLVISDEDDPLAGTVQQFPDAFAGLADGRPFATFNAVSITAGPGAAVRYHEAVTATGGATRDLREDYVSVVEDLQFERLTTEFCLSRTPDPDTLEVSVDGVLLASDAYTISAEDCVSFVGTVIASGSTIEATYEPLP